MKTKEIETCEAVFSRELETNNEYEKTKRKALEEKHTHQVSNVEDDLGTNPVIMLEREHSAYGRNFNRMTGLQVRVRRSQKRKL